MDSKDNMMAWLRGVPRIIQFVKTDIWRIREKDLPRRKSFWIRLLKVVMLTLRGITEDRSPLRASALTFYSLLSIVPVVAMVFGIAKGFGFEKALEKVLLRTLEGQEEIVIKIVGFAHAVLENVKGGLVAGIGLLVLFYAVIMILSNIENAFNDIWGIKTPRSLGRKITDYLSLMLIGPILFILSSTLTVFITSSLKQVVEKITILEAVRPGIFLLLQLLPYAALWILFCFMYVFIPNTKINFKSGILGGIIAGTMYHVFQWGYISLQIGVAKYNAIYGSFAALPLFFIWLQTSWLIVLFGAEVSFAHQNVETYEFEQECLTVSYSFKRLLVLRIAHLLVHRFTEGEKPCDARRISHQLEIPIRLVNQILFELVAAGIASEVRVEQDKAIAYEPALDPDRMTIKYVIDAMEQRGSDNIPVAPTEELQALSESLKAFNELVENSGANRLLKEI
ncbi:MAG: YihY/virulence factor BrkB family protein [Desulfobacterales bacterium]|nr:YihY/virulence factor BrkB family protein [Desulfobacterales bacterium]